MVDVYGWMLRCLSAHTVRAPAGWMGATFASVLQNIRVVAVWGVMLLLRYAAPAAGMGEPWNEYSHLQLIGCAPRPWLPSDIPPHICRCEVHELYVAVYMAGFN
jgi:hypothetical protein